MLPLVHLFAVLFVSIVNFLRSGEDVWVVFSQPRRGEYLELLPLERGEAGSALPRGRPPADLRQLHRGVNLGGVRPPIPESCFYGHGVRFRGKKVVS